MHQRSLLLRSSLLIAALLTGQAHAGSLNSSIAASASLVGDCNLAAQPLAFGSISGIQASADTQSSLTVNCTQGTAYTISMDKGADADSSTTARYMLSSGPTKYGMLYKITQDSAETQNWGNTVGTDTYAGVGNGNPQTLPVYGHIFTVARNYVLTYTDTVTVTIAY